MVTLADSAAISECVDRRLPRQRISTWAFGSWSFASVSRVANGMSEAGPILVVPCFIFVSLCSHHVSQHAHTQVLRGSDWDLLSHLRSDLGEFCFEGLPWAAPTLPPGLILASSDAGRRASWSLRLDSPLLFTT